MKANRSMIGAAALALGLAVTIQAPAQAAEAKAADARVLAAQKIMLQCRIPTGTADGVSGPQTLRGLCTFRRMSGIGTSRAALDTKTYNTLVAYAKKYPRITDIPASSYLGNATYLVAQETCQAMVYVKNNRYQKAMAISTGVSGHATPNGRYVIGSTDRGWHCSSLYPEGCGTHNVGRFAYISNFGNMYNRRHITGAVYVHGSTDVPTYPASHGCIRVTVTDSDWMYDNVGTIPTYVTGAY